VAPMSSEPTDQPAPTAPAPRVEPALPVPFSKEEAERYAAKPSSDLKSSAQTSYEDCQRIGGHGGPDGKRMYYPSGKLGPLLGEKRVCEICGRTGL
jgi:hypothetical protein